MAYLPQEKLEFALKDAKYSISMGMGNALSNSIQWVKNNPLYDKLTETELKEKIAESIDTFFHLTQFRIEKKYAEWLELNEEALKEHYGVLPDPDKTFIQEDLDLPRKNADN